MIKQQKIGTYNEDENIGYEVLNQINNSDKFKIIPVL